MARRLLGHWQQQQWLSFTANSSILSIRLIVPSTADCCPMLLLLLCYYWNCNTLFLHTLSTHTHSLSLSIRTLYKLCIALCSVVYPKWRQHSEWRAFTHMASTSTHTHTPHCLWYMHIHTHMHTHKAQMTRPEPIVKNFGFALSPIAHTHHNHMWFVFICGPLSPPFGAIGCTVVCVCVCVWASSPPF